MIEKMSKYSFILPSSGKEEFLRGIQDLGLVDITRSEKPADERSAALLDSISQQKKLISEIEAGADGTLNLYNENLGLLLKEEAAQRIWGDWDREKIEALGLKLHFYSTAVKSYDASWESSWAIQKVSEDRKKVWFVIAGDNDGFPLRELPAPTRTLSSLENDIRQLQDTIGRYSAALEARKSELPELRKKLAATENELALAFASASAGSAAEELLTMFEGFAPSEDDARLAEAFDAMDVVWFRETAVVEDNPPIEFRNNRFVKMFEVLTDMYGRPAYDGFDPTPFIAVFFMLFFAFCMGDAGYGLLLVALGFGMKKVLGDISSLVVTLGAATTVIGFLFHTFFSMDIAGWQVFEPVKGIFLPAKIAGYDGTMVLSLVIGIIHLCLAMIVKTVTSTRQKGFLNSLGTWGWTLLIVGGVAVGAVSLAGVIDAALTKWIIIAIGILSGLGIFLLNDIHRNPLANIGSGLWETYNTVTGLLGDVLSYLRLYALGLAGAMLGKAFNDIGLMILGDGSTVALWLPFVLVILVGHVLNIAMCALGAFVHPLRLNFLEFFKNSGYEAAGRNYNPLKKETD